MYKKFRIVAIPLCAIGVARYGLLPGLIIPKPEGNSSNKGIRGPRVTRFATDSARIPKAVSRATRSIS